MHEDARKKEDPLNEVCCGGARLSQALIGVGLDATAIDHRYNSDSPKCRYLWSNLTKQQDQKALVRLLFEKDAAYVHFAPPCGTASRARDIRLKRRPGSETT